MRVSYDGEADVLYVLWREPEEVRNVDREDDVVVRKDAETGEVVGYTILNFSQRADTEGFLSIEAGQEIAEA